MFLCLHKSWCTDCPALKPFIAYEPQDKPTSRAIHDNIGDSKGVEGQDDIEPFATPDQNDLPSGKGGRPSRLDDEVPETPEVKRKTGNEVAVTQVSSPRRKRILLGQRAVHVTHGSKGDPPVVRSLMRKEQTPKRDSYTQKSMKSTEAFADGEVHCDPEPSADDRKKSKCSTVEKRRWLSPGSLPPTKKPKMNDTTGSQKVDNAPEVEGSVRSNLDDVG